MAKNNLTAAIVSYFVAAVAGGRKLKEVGPTEVSKAIDGVSISLASNVKSTKKAEILAAVKSKGGTAVATAPAPTTEKLTVSQLRQVKQLIKELGGRENLKEALEALSEFEG